MGNSSSQSGGGGKSNGGSALSRRASTASGRAPTAGGGGGGMAAGHTGSMSRSASGTDITEKHHTKFVQVERLAKILQQKSHAEFGLSGICAETFVKHVFPDHPALGHRLYAHLHHASKAQTRHIGVVAFRQQCERYLAVMDDGLILETFVRMHADTRAGDSLTAVALHDLLYTCFSLAMQHYTDDGRPATCPLLERTLGAVTAAVFIGSNGGSNSNSRSSCLASDATAAGGGDDVPSTTTTPVASAPALSVGFVSRWLAENCAQLVPPVHRFCVHTLTTAYRMLDRVEPRNGGEDAAAAAAAAAATATGSIGAAGQPPTAMQHTASGGSSSLGVAAAGVPSDSAGPLAALKRRELERRSVEVATPVLDNANPFDALHPPLMPVSLAWLLACALPPIYSRAQPAAVPGTVAAAQNTAAQQQQQKLQQQQQPLPQPHQLPATVPPLASAAFMARMLSAVPSHWTLLYDSRQDGVGANRFLHHVLGYRGPTLCLLRADNEQVFCVASAAEWRESTVYQGASECCVLQVMPRFSLLESGAKLLYLNTTQRGYAKGLRAGSDPRKPIVSIDEHFETLDCRGISSPLQSIEVWGCGDQRSRDVQMDIRKWQIREAERQRTVKLTAADWLDHPDRYLLELGGRAQYNNSSK